MKTTKQFTNPVTGELITTIKANGNYTHYLNIDKGALNARITRFTELDQLYKRCSNDKKNIMREWRYVIESLSGYDVYLSGNCNTFSIAFKFVKDSVLYQAYITKAYNRIYPLNVIEA